MRVIWRTILFFHKASAITIELSKMHGVKRCLHSRGIQLSVPHPALLGNSQSIICHQELIWFIAFISKRHFLQSPMTTLSVPSPVSDQERPPWTYLTTLELVTSFFKQIPLQRNYILGSATIFAALNLLLKTTTSQG